MSVLLPVRDGVDHLSDCLASLQRQTLSEFEVVAVDDGSRDGTSELLQSWSSTDPRIKVVHTHARGLVAALQTAREHARGPLVARMDADDVCHPRRLELQARLLAERPEVGVASCLVRHFPRCDVGEGSRLYEKWINRLVSTHDIHLERFVECPVAHPSVLIRRVALDRVGGYRDMGWPEDYDLWLRLLEAGVKFAKVERIMLFWREHDGRLTWQDPRYATKRFLSCKVHFLLRGPLVGAAAVVIWGAGKTGRLLSRQLLEGGAQLKAFVDIDPVKVGRRMRGAPVVGPDGLEELLGPGVVVLAAVASRGARELIRERLVALDLEEGREYWCVA